jgi:hypothetical protein
MNDPQPDDDDEAETGAIWIAVVLVGLGLTLPVAVFLGPVCGVATNLATTAIALRKFRPETQIAGLCVYSTAIVVIGCAAIYTKKLGVFQ